MPIWVQFLLSKVPSFVHFNLFWAPLKSSPKIQGSIIFKENFYGILVWVANACWTGADHVSSWCLTIPQIKGKVSFEQKFWLAPPPWNGEMGKKNILPNLLVLQPSFSHSNILHPVCPVAEFPNSLRGAWCFCRALTEEIIQIFHIGFVPIPSFATEF